MTGAVVGAPAPQSSSLVVCPTAYTYGVEATTPGTPVYGLELTDSSGLATLTSNGLHSGWNFANGGIAAFEGVGCAYKYLNIVASTHPWKPLIWQSTQSTNTWKASPGSTITALATSSYGQTSTFLACRRPSAASGSTTWALFLLTDNVLPSATDDSLGDIVVSTCTKTVLYVNTTP
ncbi:hypothetical protein FRC05_010117 [Tulasnella sp. 425]|nr:hypothetical protein FRC05_010117 [Tulasnella sp. 425]